MHKTAKTGIAIIFAWTLGLAPAMALEDNQRQLLADKLEEQCTANLGKTLDGAMGDQSEAEREAQIASLCNCLGTQLAEQITDEDVAALTEGKVPEGYKQKAAHITMTCMGGQHGNSGS